MSTHNATTESSRFQDPRSSADFCRACYPTVNGAEPGSLAAADRNEQIMAQFAAKYYAINRASARLLEIRRNDPSPERGRLERVQMQEIEKALRERDELEDTYASYGAIVEPVMKNGFAVNLTCSFGNADIDGKARSELVTIAASVPVPLPPGARFDDFIVELELPNSLRALQGEAEAQ